MPYRTDIPGQVSVDQLQAIECVASLVPEDGVAVEVGSLFGRSSWAWAKSVPASAQVYCIDPWAGNEGIRNMEAQYGVTYGREQFEAYTADCPNIVPTQGYSPRDFEDWQRPIDLYYEDAVHTDPIFSRNIDHWCGLLKPTGIACGDDYRPRFGDIKAGVSRLAKKMQRELITVDFFWCLLPSEEVLPGAAAVAQKLQELSARSLERALAAGAKINIGPLKPVRELDSANPSAVTVRVYNAGMVAWPSDGGTLVVAINVFDQAGAKVHSAEAPLGSITSLTFDLPYDADIVLDLKDLPPGAYSVSYDISDGTGWKFGEKARRHPFELI